MDRPVHYGDLRDLEHPAGDVAAGDRAAPWLIRDAGSASRRGMGARHVADPLGPGGMLHGCAVFAAVPAAGEAARGGDPGRVRALLEFAP